MLPGGFDRFGGIAQGFEAERSQNVGHSNLLTLTIEESEKVVKAEEEKKRGIVIDTKSELALI